MRLPPQVIERSVSFISLPAEHGARRVAASPLGRLASSPFRFRRYASVWASHTPPCVAAARVAVSQRLGGGGGGGGGGGLLLGSGIGRGLFDFPASTCGLSIGRCGGGVGRVRISFLLCCLFRQGVHELYHFDVFGLRHEGLSGIDRFLAFAEPLWSLDDE